jgi:Ca-activated chloride channel family protein
MVPFRIRTAILMACLAVPAWHVRAQAPADFPPPGIHVSADGVFVRVLVTDPLNRYISGLAKENFEIYEDGTLQAIRSFTQRSAPQCLGLILDEKGSLGLQLNAISLRIANWLGSKNPQVEVFLLMFNQGQAQLITFQNGLAAPDAVPLIQSGTRDAVSFAATEALDHIRKSKAEKKAMILMADSAPKNILSPASDLGILTKQSDVQLFAISALVRTVRNPAVLPRVEGIRSFVISDRTELDYYLNLIHDELANQYVLGYSPANAKKDGKWRKIQIKLNQPKGLPVLTVRVGKGYYAEKK